MFDGVLSVYTLSTHPLHDFHGRSPEFIKSYSVMNLKKYFLIFTYVLLQKMTIFGHVNISIGLPKSLALTRVKVVSRVLEKHLEDRYGKKINK